MDNARFLRSSRPHDRANSRRQAHRRRIARSVAARVEAARARRASARAGLAVVLVGEDPASAVYVRNKRRACARVGFRSLDYDLPATTTRERTRALIDRLNADADVHGILVQLPLPSGISTARAHRSTASIRTRTSTDSMPDNVGRLALRQRGLASVHVERRHDAARAYGSSGARQKAVVVGVSNHVGRPLVLELLLAGCTTSALPQIHARSSRAKCAGRHRRSSRSGVPD